MTKKKFSIDSVVLKLVREDARYAIAMIRSGHIEVAYEMLSRKLGYSMPEVHVGPENMRAWPGAAAICRKEEGKIVIRFRDQRISESYFTALHEYGHAIAYSEGLALNPHDDELWATEFETRMVELAELKGLRSDY